MKIKIILSLLLCSFFALFLDAQDFNPGVDEIFKEDEVLEIRIAMSSDDKTFLLAEENRYSDIYVPADISFLNSELINISVPNVGVRLRGNTARGHNKRSFKIDFKEFGGEKFESYKKINLKPNVNDPSVVRELLSMHLFRMMDVPAPRVAPATLWINDEYMGVYLAVEQIDDEFIDKRFGKEVGYLYKCYYSANLSETSQVFDQELIESKMNEEADDRAALQNFVRVLNESSDADFPSAIEEVFDVSRYLRYLAVETLTGHWDGYSYLCNNYYLYYDEDDGAKFQFIAYDTDNTWGIDWIGGDWANRDIVSFYNTEEPRPLTSRILDVPAYRNRYYLNLTFLLNNYFTEDYLFPLFDRYENLLRDPVSNDAYFDDSFGFTPSNFEGAFYQESINHVAYGLRSFVETRRRTALATVPEVVLRTESNKINVFPNPTENGIFNISFHGKNSPNLKLWNMAGKEMIIETEQLSKTKIRIETSAPAGHYLLQINGVAHRLTIR